jgi:7,8-dihydropterin-6-yl-methyl-4-(beta-D-ribofuranosyl)aminobenzene 5'-phosphate synthase
MEIKVLVDNNTIIDSYYLAEPAVSYLVSDGDTRVLFDVGYSDIFIKNAQKMNESLMDINYIVISHGHNDHTGGLVSLAKFYSEAKAENINHTSPTLIAHPNAFLCKQEGNENIGSILDSKSIGTFFNTKLVSKPLWITDKLVFLGEIERGNAFENLEPIGQYEALGSMVDDYVLDDSALAYKSSQGLVIITGCSHAGICNIIEYAKKVCEDDRVVDIIGGFHLINPSAVQAEGTLRYFANHPIQNIHPCHCTSLEYKIKLSKSINIADVGVGLSLVFN